ncbi:MAG: hypothetical protein VW239_00310 [Candidatus Nanopelagicales bacterium]
MTERIERQETPWTRGVRVTCGVCGHMKKPRGRSAPLEMANAQCDDDCPGYRNEPHVGDLWPGEKRSDFGYPDACPTCAAPARTCRWSRQDDGYWETACGLSWTNESGSLEDNDMNYCPRCGAKIEAEDDQ